MDGEENDAPIIHHNVWLEPRGEPLVRLANLIFEEVEAATIRESARMPRKDALERRRLAVGNVVSSLAEVALLSGTEPAIAIDASKLAKSRYDRKDFHNGVLMGAINAIERLGLLEVTPGEFRKRRTTIRPRASLLDHLAAFGVAAGDIGVKPGGEPIELKANVGHGGHKQLVDYVETLETRCLRGEVEEIAKCLNRADLRFDGVAMPPVFIRRVFQIEAMDAVQSFNRHGRLWGGWWQNLRKEDRSFITIDGQPICDLDFKACFLNLAYVRMGEELPKGDPYQLEGLDVTYRPALKKVFSTLLFRDGDKRARLPGEIRRELPPAWTMQRLIDAFREKHPAIAPLFGSGVGLELMHTESQILVAALLDLARQGIPALGMHDGLAVAISKKEAAIAAMKVASLSVIGVELPVIEKALPVDAM